MDLHEYIDKRDKLADLYDKLIAVAARLENNLAVEQLQQAKIMLLKESFKLVVVGEFSRGKSTFINAMLGKRIMPAKTDPTTTIINKLTYGDEISYKLHFRDSEEVKNISEDEFNMITAVDDFDYEDDMEGFQQKMTELGNIAYAEIKYPLDICRNGIELIDTPGTNDLDQAREEITLRFIPEADAAILLLSAEQILARSELDFLQERILRNDIKKVFFVINFKDRLDNEDDENRVCQLAKCELEKIISNPKVFLVSSRDALKFRRAENGEAVKGMVPESLVATGFCNFEKDLAEYLLRERSKDKLRKYVSRAVNVAEDISEQSIKLRQANIGKNVAELEEAVERLLPRINKARNDSHRVFADLKMSLNLAADDFSRRYCRGLENIARQAQLAVYSYDGELNVEVVARALERIVAPLQQEQELKLRKEISENLENAFRRTQEKLQRVFQTADLGQSHALMVIDNDSRSPETALAFENCDSNETSLVGGGLLLGSMIFAYSAPFVAIPVMFFGGKYILRQFDNYVRADFLTRISQQVRERYESIIPEQVQAYKDNISESFKEIADGVEKTIDVQLTSMEELMQKLLADKKVAARDDQAEREFLANAQKEINALQKQMWFIQR